MASATREDVQQFYDLLAVRTRKYSEVRPDGKFGVRAIRVDGQLMRDLIDRGRGEVWTEALFLLLPKDAMIVDLGGERQTPGLHVGVSQANGLLTDEYVFTVASSEWERTPAREGIPVMECIIGLRMVGDASCRKR